MLGHDIYEGKNIYASSILLVNCCNSFININPFNSAHNPIRDTIIILILH